MNEKKVITTDRLKEHLPVGYVAELDAPFDLLREAEDTFRIIYQSPREPYFSTKVDWTMRGDEVIRTINNFIDNSYHRVAVDDSTILFMECDLKHAMLLASQIAPEARIFAFYDASNRYFGEYFNIRHITWDDQLTWNQK